MRFKSARLLLVFALLFAQLGAQMHAYSHLRAASQPAAVTGSVTPLCTDCLGFAPLFSATHPAAESSEFGHGAADAPIAVAARSLTSGLLLHAFRSRAPPSV